MRIEPAGAMGKTRAREGAPEIALGAGVRRGKDDLGLSCVAPPGLGLACFAGLRAGSCWGTSRREWQRVGRGGSTDVSSCWSTAGP